MNVLICAVFPVPQTKERGFTRVHALNNVNKVLQVLHQNNVSALLYMAVFLTIDPSAAAWWMLSAKRSFPGLLNQCLLRPKSLKDFSWLSVCLGGMAAHNIKHYESMCWRKKCDEKGFILCLSYSCLINCHFTYPDRNWTPNLFSIYSFILYQFFFFFFWGGVSFRKWLKPKGLNSLCKKTQITHNFPPYPIISVCSSWY